MILFEFPHYARPVASYASKNGKYVRPVKGKMADLRSEDMGPDFEAMRRSRGLVNLIGKLPDIIEANQVGVWLFSNFGACRATNDATKAQQLIESGQYCPLPDSPDSEYWHFTQRPWWEFMLILDEYGGPIKAAPLQTNTQFTVETVDERLDEYPENQGQVTVLSPFTFEKMKNKDITESYQKKLARIRL